MQLEELLNYLEWLDREVRQPNLVQLYQRLYKILQQNSQPNQQQPFEAQRDALKKGLLEVDLHKLNRTQLDFAEHMGLLAVVGQDAVDAIDDVLFRNALDVATAANRIEEMRSKLDTILQHMNQVAEGMAPYLDETEIEYEEALLHVRFQRESSISNVTELRRWSDAWFEIGRGVALAHRMTPEDIRVVGASRGSIIYDLAVTYGVAQTLGGIILLVLKVAERALDVRKKAEEIRSLKLSNDKAAFELEEEAKRIEATGKEEVFTELEKRHSYDGEQKNALSKAIDRMFEFVSGGGEVDVHVEEPEVEEPAEGEEPTPADADTQKRIGEIRSAFDEIKKVERKILLLEHNDKD